MRWVFYGRGTRKLHTGAMLWQPHYGGSVWKPQSSVELLSPVGHHGLQHTGFPVHHQLTQLAQTHVIELVTPSNHLILCHHLLCLPSIFPSIRVFSNKLALHIRWPKYWSFSFSTSPSNEYSGLISFWIDWLGLLAVQGTLKSFLQLHSSKHQFFGTQLSLWSNCHIHTWLLEKFWLYSFD